MLSEPTPASQSARPGSAARTLRLPLTASRRLVQAVAALLLLMAALPLIALWAHLPDSPIWLLLLVGVWALLVAYGYRLRRWWRHHPCALELGESQWCLYWRHRHCSVAPVGDLLVWPWLVVVRLHSQESNERWTLVCLPDSSDAEALRRFRVWLTTRLR